MKLETILDAMLKSRKYLIVKEPTAPRNIRGKRQYRAFRDRILWMDAEKERLRELLKDTDRAISLLYQGATPLLISDKTLTVLDFIQERIKKELSDG